MGLASRERVQVKAKARERMIKVSQLHPTGGKPAAPDWWTKMAVPGMAVPPQPMQAAQTQNLATGSPGEEGIANHPRLTSTILRAHEAKMACCDSIQRYGNPNVQPQPRWQPPRQAPMRNNDVADNCVIS